MIPSGYHSNSVNKRMTVRVCTLQVGCQQIVKKASELTNYHGQPANSWNPTENCFVTTQRIFRFKRGSITNLQPLFLYRRKFAKKRNKKCGYEVIFWRFLMARCERKVSRFQQIFGFKSVQSKIYKDVTKDLYFIFDLQPYLAEFFTRMISTFFTSSQE